MSESLREKAKRHPQIINRVLAGGLAAMLLVSAVLAFSLNSEQQKNAENATQSALSQSAIEAQRAQAQSLALVAQAQLALDAGDSTLALSLALEANHIEPPLPEVRDILMKLLYAPGIKQVIPVPLYFPYPVNSPLPWSKFSADGRILILNNGDEVLRIDTATGEVLNHFRASMTTISPDGRYMVDAETCLIYDTTTGEQTATVGAPGSTCNAWLPRFSPDQALLLILERTTAGEETSTLYATDTWQPVYHVPPYRENTSLITAFWDNDGRFFALYYDIRGSGRPSYLVEWNLAAGSVVQKTELTFPMYDMLEPFNHYLYMISAAGEIALVDLNTLTLTRLKQIPVTGNPRLIALSPDGRTLLVNTGNDMIAVIDATTLGDDYWQSLGMIRRFKLPGVIQAVFSPDSLSAQMLTHQGLVTIDLVGAMQFREYQPDLGELSYGMTNDFRLNFAPDHALILSVGNSLFRLDSATYQPLWKRSITGTSDIYRFAYAPGAERAAYYDAGTIIIIDAVSGEVLKTLTDLPQALRESGFNIEFSTDGKWLALSGYNQLAVYEVNTGTLFWTDATTENLPGYVTDSHSALFDSTGKHLFMVGSMQVGVLTLDAASPEFRFFPFQKPEIVVDMELSVDGSQLLLLENDSTLTRTDTTTGEIVEQKRLLPEEMLSCGALDPAADSIVLCSGLSNQMILMKLSTSEIQLIQYIDQDMARWLNGAAFSPDWQTLAIQWQKGIRLWHLPSDAELLDYARTQRYLPDFTCEQRLQYHLAPCSPELPATQTPPPTWTPPPMNMPSPTAPVIGTLTPTPLP